MAKIGNIFSSLEKDLLSNLDSRQLRIHTSILLADASFARTVEVEVHGMTCAFCVASSCP